MKDKIHKMVTGTAIVVLSTFSALQQFGCSVSGQNRHPEIAAYLLDDLQTKFRRLDLLNEEIALNAKEFTILSEQIKKRMMASPAEADNIYSNTVSSIDIVLESFRKNYKNIKGSSVYGEPADAWSGSEWKKPVRK